MRKVKVTVANFPSLFCFHALRDKPIKSRFSVLDALEVQTKKVYEDTRQVVFFAPFIAIDAVIVIPVSQRLFLPLRSGKKRKEGRAVE